MLSTKSACKALSLSPQFVNDAISNGFLPFAEPTIKGKARFWTETQFLGLYIFAQYVRSGYHQRSAGTHAAAYVAQGFDGNKVVRDTEDFVETIYLTPGRKLFALEAC